MIKLIPVTILGEGRSSVDGGLVEAVAAVAVEPDTHGFEVPVGVHGGLIPAMYNKYIAQKFYSSRAPITE